MYAELPHQCTSRSGALQRGYLDVACTGVRSYNALAPLVRKGCIHLGIGTGRGLSSACGAAEAEACEMSIDLRAR